MKKLVLALAGAAAAVAGLAAVPAQARHYTNHVVCARWHYHRCIVWRRLTVRQARRAGYRVGYVFGPNYAYTPVTAIPHPYVVRYRLSPDYRYVYQGGYIYVVDPTSYAITRIIRAL